MTRIRSALMLCLFAAFLLSAALPVHATYFSVGCTNGVGDVAQFRAHINTAMSSGGTDTIWLAPDCTYTLTQPLTIGAGTAQSLTIQGQGGTVISGNNAVRVFNITAPTIPITLQTMTIQNGYATSGAAAIHAGNSSNLTLDNVTVRNNRVSYGGTGYGYAAIYAYGGWLTITNSTIIDNDGFYGGAVAAERALVQISSSTIRRNTAVGPGGGLYILGRTYLVFDLTVTSSTISENIARGSLGGGGVYLLGQDTGAQFSNTRITNNYGGTGGGIFASSADLSLINTIVSGNLSGPGGGIYIDGYDPDVTISGSTINGNRSLTLGGGMDATVNMYGSLSISTSTFAGNRAQTGGAVRGIGMTTIADAIMSGNYASLSGSALEGSIFDVDRSAFIGNRTETSSAIYAAFGSDAYITEVDASCFEGNTPYAMLTRPNAYDLRADGNWWGDPTGPGGEGSGFGDAVGAHVIFAPFLTSPPAACQNLPTDSVVSMFAAPPYLIEGGTGTLTIMREIPTNAPLTVNFTRGGTANAEDYILRMNGTDITGDSITIPADHGFAPIDFVAVRNFRDEQQNDTVILTLVDDPTYTVTDYARSIEVEIEDYDVSRVWLYSLIPVPSTLIEGETLTYEVNITTIPYADVTVTVHFDPAEVAINGETDGSVDLVFNESNWNTPQTLMVTVVDDAVPENEWVYQFLEATTITHTVTSADALYNGYPVPDFPLNIRDNDVDICAVQDQIPVSECRALIDLYESTNGDGWTNRGGWLEGTTICGMWEGVVCEYLPPAGGDPLVTPEPNEWANVVGLELSQNNLTGTLPDSFINLSHLRYVNMHSNAITGTLPELESLSELYSLSLSRNQLNGEIPSLPSEIVTILLAHNQLTGSIPEIAGLSALIQLELHDNQLSGEIPPLPPTLYSLALDDNLLSGSIPPLPAALNYFSASSNQLTGSIPTLPPILEYLFLDNNQLTGSLPPLPESLIIIQVPQNDMTGSIPPLPPSLIALGVAGNQFSGALPEFPAPLLFIDVADNALTGVVPPSITQTAISEPHYMRNLYLCGGENDLASDDPAVNTFIEAYAPGWSPLNGCLPRLSVIDVVDVVPDPPVAPVGSVDVILSELADISTFTYQDVTLMRGSTPVTLDSSVTVALHDAPTFTYRISGLTSFTTPFGVYTLTVNAAGLRDQFGLLPTSPSTASETWTWVETGSLTVEVDLQGRPAAPHASYLIPVDVTLETAGGDTVLHETITLDTYGMFALNNLIPGNYTLRVKPSNGLALSQAITLTSGANSVYMGMIPTGDANGDNRVSLLDFSLLAQAFGTSQGAPGYNPAVDFNGNTVIDLLDFSALASNYGTAGAD